MSTENKSKKMTHEECEAETVRVLQEAVERLRVAKADGKAETMQEMAAILKANPKGDRK